MRRFRIQVVASLLLEGTALTRIGLLMSNPLLWKCFPLRSQNVSMRGLAFRMLSKLGCTIHQLLCHPATLPSISIFQLLSDPDFLETVLSWPPCFLDQAVKDFLDSYDDLTGTDALAFLTWCAAHIQVDNIEVERFNAMIRRWLTSRSHSTHAMLYENLGAEWICHQARVMDRKATASIAAIHGTKQKQKQV